LRIPRDLFPFSRDIRVRDLFPIVPGKDLMRTHCFKGRPWTASLLKSWTGPYFCKLGLLQYPNFFRKCRNRFEEGLYSCSSIMTMGDYFSQLNESFQEITEAQFGVYVCPPSEFQNSRCHNCDQLACPCTFPVKTLSSDLCLRVSFVVFLGSILLIFRKNDCFLL